MFRQSLVRSFHVSQTRLGLLKGIPPMLSADMLHMLRSGRERMTPLITRI